MGAGLRGTVGHARDGTGAEAAPFAYVANSGDGTVSVIDTATHKVVATIPVGKGGGGALTPDDGVAVTPDGKRAYVANSGSNTVSVIDTVSNKVVGTVQVGNDPHGVAVSPDGTHVYVANFSPDNTVSVIETVTNTVVASPQSGEFPFGVAVTPDGKDVYVTNFYGDSVIDTASNTVVATVPFSLPKALAVISVSIQPGRIELAVILSAPARRRARAPWR